MNNESSQFQQAAEDRLTQTIEDWEEYIHAHPMGSLAAGAAAGFVLGGGLRSKTGMALMLYAARIALREAAWALFAAAAGGPREPREREYQSAPA